MRQVKTTTRFLREPISVDKTETIETLTDVVTVPAGTFENCIRIKSSGKTLSTLRDHLEPWLMSKLKGLIGMPPILVGLKVC